jgi:EpsI family protein
VTPCPRAESLGRIRVGALALKRARRGSPRRVSLPSRPPEGIPILPQRLLDSLSPSDAQAERRLVGAIFVALLVAYGLTIVSFPPTWNVSYQEHGFFVGGLVLWLVWRDRERLFREAGERSGDLLPVLALLSMVWMLAIIMNVRLIHQGVFVVVTTLWAVATFGWATRRTVLAIGLTAMLGVPFWSIAVPVLQRATVIASGGATKLAGITAEIGYDYVAIRSGTFLVEEGCAGINYLMGGLVLGAFYAHLFTSRWQTQVKIVALAGGMAIVGNWIRVATLIFLGEATAMQSPYIQDHLWQGWAIFTLLMIPTYFLARRIEIVDARRAGAHVSFEEETESRQEVGVNEAVRFGGTSEPVAAAAAFDPFRPRFALGAALCAALGPILLGAFSVVPRGQDLERDAAVFGIEPGWTATERAVGEAEWLPAFSGVDHRSAWTFESAGRTLDAARHYFVDQRQGEELIQYDNFIAPDSLLVSERLIGPLGPTRRVVREAIVRASDGPQVVWYWYRVAGYDTPFDSKAKLLEVLSFFVRSPASELVTMSASCAPKDCTEAATALRAAVGLPMAAPSFEDQPPPPEQPAPEDQQPR